MQVFLLLGAGIMLVLQRVAPLPRIWGYLEMFYLFFSVTGLIWITSWVIKYIWHSDTAMKILSGLVLLIALVVFTNVTLKTQNKKARANRWIAPEFFVADYIKTHMTETDTVIAVAPSDIQTAYYLMIDGISYDIFYQRKHPSDFDRAFVLVRTRGGYNINSLDKLLDFYQLSESLSADAESPVLEYGPLLLYEAYVK